MMNAAMQAYRRESLFYASELREYVYDKIGLPGCIVNLYEPDTDRALLVLGHIDGRRGDVFEGATVAELSELLIELAKLHGSNWMSPALIEIPWMFTWRADVWAMGTEMLREAWPKLLADRPGMIPPGLAAAIERTLIADVPAAFEKMYARPRTLAHGDFGLDNIVWSQDRGPVVLDWQTVMRSFPGLDVAYLLATSATPDTIEAEAELLDVYRAALAEHGGPDWSRDELLTDACFGLLFYVAGLTIPVVHAELSPGDARTRARHELTLARCVAAAERWACADRL